MFQQQTDGRNCGKNCQTFDVKGSGGANKGSGYSINNSGMITGDYTDSNGADHGFVRSADGTITNVDVVGAGTGMNQGTLPESINDSDEIAGFYIDGANVAHGFVRSAKGHITTFDPPGSTSTDARSINATGEITGEFLDGNGVQRGYLRTP